MGYSLKEFVTDVRWLEWLVRNIRMKAQEGKQILREETLEQTRGKISNASENRTHIILATLSTVKFLQQSWRQLFHSGLCFCSEISSVPTEIRLFTRNRILRYLWKEIKSCRNCCTYLIFFFNSWLRLRTFIIIDQLFCSPNFLHLGLVSIL